MFFSTHVLIEVEEGAANLKEDICIHFTSSFQYWRMGVFSSSFFIIETAAYTMNLLICAIYSF